MDSRKTSLILLGINFAFIGVITYLVYLVKSTPGSTQHVTETRTVTNTVTQIVVRKINATNLLGLARRPANWAALESANYHIYIANLRSFGCPQETIKDIILTDIARLYARKRSETRRKGEPYRYWMPQDASTIADPKLQRQLAELDGEQRNRVRDLLAAEGQSEMAKYWYDETDTATHEFLTARKRDKVSA